MSQSTSVPSRSVISITSSTGTSTSTSKALTTRPTQHVAVAVADPGPLPQLDSVRERVASTLAFRASQVALTLPDGSKAGVCLTRSRADDVPFLHHVALKLKHHLALSASPFLFLIAPSGPHLATWPLLIFGSSPHLVDKAATLTCAKFLGRLSTIQTDSSGLRWLAHVEDAGASELDEGMLWDIVRKTTRVVDPNSAPSGSRSIDDILQVARTRLERVSPAQVLEELRDPSLPFPVVLVDTRPAQQREEFGEIPESLVVERNVLEWRFDPRSDSRLSIADRYDLRVIIFCQEGYASSLAAVSLQEVGLLNATDMIGGYKAWKEAGLPTFEHISASQYSKANTTVTDT